MAYSVNWATKVITIPKADLTLVSASPEVRSLDVTDLWEALIDIQDSEEGMNFLDIVRNTPPLTFAGVTLARVVEVINGYTLTFENGAWNVNIIGGNSNVADVANKNSVGVNTANSAGLINVAGGGSLTAAQVWQYLIEDGKSAEQFMRIIMSVLAGKVSGAGTGTESFRDLADAINRVVSTVDNDGNRTAVTLNGA